MFSRVLASNCENWSTHSVFGCIPSLSVLKWQENNSHLLCLGYKKPTNLEVAKTVRQWLANTKNVPKNWYTHSLFAYSQHSFSDIFWERTYVRCRLNSAQPMTNKVPRALIKGMRTPVHEQSKIKIIFYNFNSTDSGGTQKCYLKNYSKVWKSCKINSSQFSNIQLLLILIQLLPNVTNVPIT